MNLETSPTPSARGQERAQAFDRRLRERELMEREACFAALIASGIEAEVAEEVDTLSTPQDSASRAEHLPFERYYHAVQNSRAWRLVQFLRALVGRRW